jgi:perosamine synthetase
MMRISGSEHPSTTITPFRPEFVQIMNSKIPVYEPVLGPDVRRNVLECIDSNWISSRGRFVDRFEHEFAAYVGSPHAASVCNGTVALHLALLALNLGPGDEVIVPTFTYIASVNAIAYVGATPVFVDSLPDTWQLDPEDVRRKITPRTRSIVVVHLYGQPAQMDEVMKIAQEHRLSIVEDCAEAIGSRFGDRHVGTFGDVATWSFFGNKTITTGEGGMVTTSRTDLDAGIRKLKGQGLAGHREYWHDVIGYNYRMTNICAAIGVAQLPHAREFLERKRVIATAYRDGLASVPVEVLWQAPGTINSFWMNCVAVRDAAQRDPLRKHLASEGIETRPTFYPAHSMPMYERYGTGKYPVAEALATRGMNLPSSPALTDQDVTRIVESIWRYFR